MEAIKRIVSYQYEDSKKSMLKFWLVIIIVDIFLYLLNMFGPVDGGAGMMQWSNGMSMISIMGANLMAILVYLIVYNYENYYKGFPIAISFSVTRKDFFKSIVAKNLWIALILGIIQGILMIIDPILVASLGRTPLIEFILFNVKLDNLVYIIFSISILMLYFLSFWSLIAALNYRFGYIIWIIYGAFHILLTTLNISHIYKGAIQYLYKLFISRMDLAIFLGMSIIILVCHALTYLVTINTNIKGQGS